MSDIGFGLKSNAKFSYVELKKDLKDFCNFSKSNQTKILLTSFFILMAYGIKLFYYSISIDTEAIINNYEGQLYAWTSIGRFGLILTKRLLNLAPFNPYVACFLMLCTILLFSIFLSFLFHYLTFEKEYKSKLIFVFPCVFVTAPLFAEQFNFTLQGFEVSFAILLASVGAFLVTKWVLDSKNVLHLGLSFVCMVWAFASYQAVVFLYISIVLACFFSIYNSNIKNKIILSENFFKAAAIKYLITFVCGYALYFAFNKIITISLGSPKYLENMISWGSCDWLTCVRSIVGYVLRGKLYLVLALILLYYGFVNLFTSNKNKVLFFTSTVALVASPFFLAIYLGHGLIARSQFSLQFVAAFALYFILHQSQNKKILKSLVVTFSLFLSFSQAYKVSSLLYTDYMKYQSEVALANKISTKIDALNLDSLPEHPVVFVGSVHPTNTPIERRAEVIGASFFEWDREIEFGSNYRILGFMKTIGYPYKIPNQDEIDRGKIISKSMPTWPSNGSVKFQDGLIIVKLSD